MASTAAPARRDGAGEKIAEAIVLGGMAALGVAFVAPPALVAVPVLGALYGLRRRSWRVQGPCAVLCAVPALAGLAGAYATHGALPGDVVAGYVDVQLDAAAQVARVWQSGGATAFDWGAYGLAVGPYATAGGLALGTLGNSLLSLRRRHLSDETKRNEDSEWVFRDAGEMANAPERRMSWAVPNTVGRGVVSLLSAPPGLGKGWWTWGMLRAMQDGGSFFGLEVHRPHTAPNALARRLGATAKPLKVLWLTEEGQSFGETAKRFGIAPGLVTVLQRSEVAATDWPAIVKRIKREAWRRGCAYVIVDTIRAWCPQAEHSNSHAADVFNLARKELAAPGLGVLFVHHDTKAGGEYGAGVAGPNNLVGSTDVLIELRRVVGDPTARRMLVSRRFGDQDVTARLDGVRYVVGDQADPVQGHEDADAEAPVPGHLQPALDALREALGRGEGMSVEALQVATRKAGTTLSRQLGALEDLKLAERKGAGVKGDPLTWWATAQPSEAAPAPPTSDPAYVRYLGSKAWAVTRDAIRVRADGVCEQCGDAVAEGEMEVHHLTYERVGRELPEDLIGLCPGCHRRAHA